MNVSDLPKVSGSISQNASLDKLSFFGVGGKADVLFTPDNIDDLVFFLKNRPNDLPITVIGACSNLLIRDGGVRGVVIKLGAWFNHIFINDDIFEVGAANNVSKLANKAADSGLAGFEFLSGIPGTAGGALIMNAGCYGSSISDVFIEAEAVDFDGSIHWLTKEDINFEYRHTSICNMIITRMWLRGTKSDSATVAKNTYNMVMKRRGTQPIIQRSCGSAFKNPKNCQEKAWQLIDQAGCRGLKVGDAMVSDVHCNFIVNNGKATAADIEELGEEVIRRVYNTSGIKLEWEIVKIGEKL